MAQAKRSPILGYNHNVKYRGVIFHVQTEDSGQQNPHLFTHLFHEGVIVSTRKYVYDAGSNEEAIKGLMQAQHKAVMKDLKRGAFDDKIDTYLGGTAGLEPRPGADPAAPPLPRGERAKTEANPTIDEVPEAPEPATSGTPTRHELEIIEDDLSAPIELPLKSRTASNERTRPVEMPIDLLMPPMPSADIDPPTTHDADMAAAVAAANATAAEPPPNKPRVSTAQKVSRSGVSQTPMARPAATVGAAPRPNVHNAAPLDITEEEISSRLRTPRDTAVETLPDSDSTMPVQTARSAAHSAASLPGARPGMQAGASPPIVALPRADDGVVEIYQTAPPSVEPPPGERSERAGTYSVNRKSSDAPIREKTGRIAALSDPSKSAPVPSGLARPGGGQRSPTGETPRPPQPPRPTMARTAVPPPTPSRPGTPQPMQPRPTAPIQNRTTTPANPQSNSGVVMTRPAVIVGAPPKPPAGAPTTSRIRKAREDEGRGFGQGLISEKSLDEVILAYLSEDAEDK